MRSFVVSVSIVIAANLTAGASEAQFRRPVAVVASSDSKLLFTANRDSGTISIVDVASRTVIDEITVGGRLSELVMAPEHGLLFALDQRNHEFVVLKHIADQWKITKRATIADAPVRLVWHSATNRCFISSLWSRTVTALHVSQKADAIGIEVTGTIQLPFEPREMCLAGEGRHLMVADAFAGGLAVIDTAAFQLKTVKNVPGHNIRGLAISADKERLLVAQQELNPLARSSRDDVHWGNLMANLLVAYPVERICDPEADIASHRMAYQLGEPGNAAGDPGPIVLGPNGEINVLLSGVHEVALGTIGEGGGFRRVAVGMRPMSAVATGDGMIFVANLFSDSVSVVDIDNAQELDRISLGPSPQVSRRKQGEMLFFDSRLSHDGWMSCHSCHPDGHSNGQLNDNLSDGSFGAAKRVLSLLGVAETKPWAWNGKVDTLEEQVVNSIRKTMQGVAPDDEQVAALVAYLKTLSLSPVSIDATTQRAVIDRGRVLFRSLDCNRCHIPPTYTSPETYDVSLSDQVGNDRFNPPSLRGVAKRRSYFHDARATSLRAVLTDHKHQLGEDLSDLELDVLLAFLNSI